MRIGIDARMYSQSGIGRYISNLLECLQVLDKKNSYFILLGKDDYKNLNFKNNFQKVYTKSKWYSFSEQIEIPRILSKLDLDLVHFPHFNVPFLYRGKFIVTIHDLIHQNFSMKRATTLNPLFYTIKKYGYKTIFDYALRRSRKIITPSFYVKDQILKNFKIENKKIEVTYEAADNRILDLAHSSKTKGLERLEKNSIKRPYIFYVGNAHPHKNVEGLIKAFLILKEKYSSLKLVLAGSDHYFWRRVKQEFKHQDIIYAGHINDEQLVMFYKNAECFVLPSFEEGFGIPVLEAMSCACPVVCSNVASLPEIGADACVYFNPRDIKDIANKIDRILSNQELRVSLISKGLKRFNQFSWDNLAKQTLKIYQEV